MAYGTYQQPDKDAGWGLIFRLNDLWRKADFRAETGNFDGWEIVLDRIYSNLLYREAVVIVEDEETGEIVDIELDAKDRAQFEIVKKKIVDAKREVLIAQSKKNVVKLKQAKLNHYKALMLYDIWLRKFMQAHQLYLKEVDSNPSNAMFGGAFKKHRI